MINDKKHTYYFINPRLPMPPRMRDTARSSAHPAARGGARRVPLGSPPRARGRVTVRSVVADAEACNMYFTHV